MWFIVRRVVTPAIKQRFGPAAAGTGRQLKHCSEVIRAAPAGRAVEISRRVEDQASQRTVSILTVTEEGMPAMQIANPTVDATEDFLVRMEITPSQETSGALPLLTSRNLLSWTQDCAYRVTSKTVPSFPVPPVVVVP